MTLTNSRDDKAPVMNNESPANRMTRLTRVAQVPYAPSDYAACLCPRLPVQAS